MFDAVFGMLQHANIDVRLGPLNRIFSMAEPHRWHHSRTLAEANSNYGSNLIVWDLVFGTFFLPSDREAPREIGIADLPRFPTGYLAQLATPFRWTGGARRERARQTTPAIATDAGSSASANTSSIDDTGWNRITLRTSSGTSSRSRAIALGQDDVGEPGRVRGQDLLLEAADRKHASLSVTSPVMPTVDLTGRPVSSDASAVVIVMPALGPSFGTAPAGTCTWKSRRLKRSSSTLSLARMPTDVA